MEMRDLVSYVGVELVLGGGKWGRARELGKRDREGLTFV
jgi:hypothetical protein